jgi:membrane associated rhomboid family serine protease
MQQSPLQFKLLPEVIKNLLIINGLFFLASVVFGNVFGTDLTRLLGVYLPQSEQFMPFQIVTHMFMHGNLGHIFFNMFALWMFGNALENVWGPKRFLIYYFVTGLGAALLHLGIQYWEYSSLISQLTEGEVQTVLREGASLWETGRNYTNPIMGQANALLNSPTVGASGAVFGVLLAFGMLFPNQYIYIYFVLPVKVKYFVAVYGALELYNGIANDPASNVAHFAHLGGMLFGFLLLRYWKKNNGTFY